MSSEVLGRFEQLLRFASTRGISDIHIKPGQRLLYRRGGALISRKDEATFSEADLDEIAHGLVPGAWLDDWAKGEDVTFPHGVVGCGRFRVTLLHQRGSVGVVVHVVPNKAQALRELNLPKPLASWAMLSRGLVLVSGSPGTGRSATWQALVEHINISGPYPRHVVTVEEPIEVLFDDKMAFIRQRQLRTDVQDLPTALNQFARMDCDVVAIGDLPLEHLESALTLCEQGRLVLAVVTGGATIDLLRQLVNRLDPVRQGPLRQRLAAQLKGIIYQKLLMNADGKSRLPVAEVVTFAGPMLDILRGTGDLGALLPLIESTRSSGNQLFDQNLLDLAHQGVIGVDQALAVAEQPESLRARLSGMPAGTQVSVPALTTVVSPTLFDDKPF